MMVFNEPLQKVISNLGWVDKGCLWEYDGVSQKNYSVKLSDSKYLSLRAGKDGYFSVVHHDDTDKLEISIHHCKEPEHTYCTARFDNFKTSFSGDVSYWQFVPNYYVVGLELNNDFDFHLLSVRDGVIVLEDNKIEWYTKGDFDFMYQGLTGVTEVNNELIFTVQRDGSLYRYSLELDKITDRVKLAGNSGNPMPTIINDEIWVSDYHTLIRLENWKIKEQRKLQEAEQGTGQFIGDFSFNSESGLCILARPFSGDVIGLNKDFKIKYTCKTSKQPIEAVLMKNHQVIARDWKTGELLKGMMKRKWF